MKRFLTSILAPIALLGATLPVHSDDDFFAIRKNFEIFGAIYEDLVLDYVDDVDAERLMRAGLTGMLAELDPYTVFFDEAANQRMDVAVSGKTGSPGLTISSRGGQIIVESPEFGSSGYRQGILTGDIIISVAGRSVTDLSPADVQTLLRGDPGTVVNVEIERAGVEGTLTFRLAREKISFRSVSHSALLKASDLSDIGYVKLARFGRHAAAEVAKTLDSLNRQQSLDALILDLRNNPGGLLGEAVGVSSLFLPSGTSIVSTSGQSTETAEVYKTEKKPVYPDKPLFILVNGISASASEIVAGAMQDLDRAVIIGDVTFGKGLVQVVNQLPYNTSLKITTSRYFIPSGRSIQRHRNYLDRFEDVPDSVRSAFSTRAGRMVRDGNGIEPDVITESVDQSEYIRALQQQSAFFFFANDYMASQQESAPARVSEQTLESFRTWIAESEFTYQTGVDRAIDALRNEAELAGYTVDLSETEASILQARSGDFDRHRESIISLLEAELLSRYIDDASMARAMVLLDPTVIETLALASDIDRYDILRGKR